MKSQLLQRLKRMERSIGVPLQQVSMGGQYKYSIGEWTDDEIKEYFFRQPDHLVAKAEETDWNWIMDNTPGNRLKRFLEGCTYDELKMLETLAIEAEDSQNAEKQA